MLYSISGSQGCGKTTLVNAISEKHNVPIVGRKTARSILEDWNITLTDIYQDLELLCDFQTEVLSRKQLDEADHVTTDQIIITERSYMDLFAYATVYFGGHPKYHSWLEEYYDSCIRSQSDYICTYFIDRGDIPLIEDGIRPYNIHYANLIDRYLGFLLESNQFEIKKLQNGINASLDVAVMLDISKYTTEFLGND